MTTFQLDLSDEEASWAQTHADVLRAAIRDGVDQQRTTVDARQAAAAQLIEHLDTRSQATEEQRAARRREVRAMLDQARATPRPAGSVRLLDMAGSQVVDVRLRRRQETE